MNKVERKFLTGKMDGAEFKKLDPAIKIALTEALDAAVISMTAKVISASEE
ncbi:MAG: hypothetical protein Q7S22_02930 [Candidatus Micrarchaeota archaeon]|nr:hypothetical protein [Candidatus Micrarchaeota archaeon]